jgi:hypothetical protein
MIGRGERNVTVRAGTRKRWAVDRQQFLILLVAAVMMTSFVLLVCWPQKRELAALGLALEYERDLVTRKVLASNEGMYVSARIPGLRMAQGVFCRCLPPQPRVAEFLAAVAESVAAEPDVTHEIERAGARPSEPPGPAPAVPLRLRLTGPFEGVYRCLAAIETLERLSRFRHVRCMKAQSAGCVVAEADVLVFYLPESDENQTSPGGTGGGDADARQTQG